MNEEIKKRSLSAKSQARLDMARWRSNGSCVFHDSELVVDPLSISKSRLTVRTQSVGYDPLDDLTVVSSVAEILKQNHDSEEGSSCKIALDRTRPASTLSILKNTSPRASPFVLNREHSDMNPYDEADYNMLLRQGLSSNSPITAPLSKQFAKKPSTRERKQSTSRPPPRTTSYESILDGHRPDEDEDILASKIIAPTHRVLPERRRSKSRSPAKYRRAESPQHMSVEVKRSVSFADSEPGKPQRRWSLGRRRDKSPSRVVVEDPGDHATFCGWCFDSSCVWLFGEPTDVLDNCGCHDSCVCARVEGYSVAKESKSRGKTKGGNDSLVETCSSSEDSMDKKPDSPESNPKKTPWWRRRRNKPKEIRSHH